MIENCLPESGWSTQAGSCSAAGAIFACDRQLEIQRRSNDSQSHHTQPVGLGMPPYLVIGFIGPVIQSSNTSF